MHRRDRRLVWLGLFFMLTGSLSYFLVTSPIAAFFDPRIPGLVVVSVGLVLWAWRGGRHLRRIAWRSAAHLTVLVVAGLLTVRAFWGHREIDVRVRNGEVTLAGTLFEPRRSGPSPAVILMHGSSPGRRTVFRPLANRFVNSGIAALAYDKRGFGASEGELPYTYEELAGDALAGLRYLERRPEIDASEIGLMGFSEGGWSAPLAASRSGDVAFLVVVSGGAISPAEQEMWEMRVRLEDAHFPAAQITRAVDLRRRLDDYYRSGEGGDSLMSVIQSVKGERWFQIGFELRPEDVPASLDDVQYAHDPTELDFDALPLLETIDSPMLFVFGAEDEVVPPERSASLIRAALSQARAPDFQITTFPDADHLILVWPFGHSVPVPRFAPGYPDTLTTWIWRHTELSSGPRGYERPGGAGGLAGVSRVTRTAAYSARSP